MGGSVTGCITHTQPPIQKHTYMHALTKTHTHTALILETRVGDVEPDNRLVKEGPQDRDARERVSHMIVCVFVYTSLFAFLCTSTWRAIAGLLITLTLNTMLVISPLFICNRLKILPSYGPVPMDVVLSPNYSWITGPRLTARALYVT